MSTSFTHPRGITRFTALVIAFSLLLSLAVSGTAQAQDDVPTDEVVIFVLDLSGSMNEPFDAERTKLDVAKAAFVEAFASVSPDALVGLRTYGDQIEATGPASREPSCTADTRLVSPVAPLAREQLISQVQGFAALGDTPIALALQRAAGDVPPNATATIVLFSDGRDECFDADLDGDPTSGPSYGQDPCAVAENIIATNSSVGRVVTVGFRADTAAESELRCIAESTGGAYTAIETPEDARDLLPELLVQLSAPREAKRLVGIEIQGTTSIDTAPDFVRLNETDTRQVLYTDAIPINTEKVYRLSEYGPGAGTLTATVFGLPAQSGIEFNMRMWVPARERLFFEDRGDFDAGLPARPSASIRCTDCLLNGGPVEAYWIISLESADPAVTGTYELEILTEGTGFGGPPTTCTAPQACAYSVDIDERTERLAELNERIASGTSDLADDALIAERDQLREVTAEAQTSVDLANQRSTELEARIALAPAKGTSFRLPLLLLASGLVLAFAPFGKLKRSGKSDDDDDASADGEASGEPLDMPPVPVATAEPSPSDADVTTSPLDVGPAPAVSPTRKKSGDNWDAELEAAKAALALQLPTRPDLEGAPGAPAAPGFTPEQHAAAQAAAEQIAAQQAATAPIALGAPEPTTPPAAPGFTPEQHAAAQAAAEQIAAQQAAADKAATEQAVAAAAQAEELATQQAAAQQAAAVQAAAAEQPTARTGPPAGGFTPEQHAAAKAAAERIAAERAAAQAAAAAPAATPVAAAASLAAGWYTDPAKPDQFRWWDGVKWTEHTTTGNNEGAT